MKRIIFLILEKSSPYHTSQTIQGRAEIMKRHLWIIVTVLVILPLLAFAQEGNEVDELLAKGAECTEKHDHEGAAVCYTEVLKVDPDNYEALWKAGDSYTEIADRLPKKQKDQKENYFEMAREYCEKAIEANPEGWEGHFRLAVVLGRLALFRGGKEKIKLSEQVKEEGDKALALNPEADGVYHLLGRWHQNLANLSGMLKFFAKVLYGGVPPASNEEAVTLFQKAIELKPTHIEHHLELARTYKFMKKKDLMREPLEKVLALPNVEQDDPVFKEEAQEMLKKLK
jgi:tetratricopeptide (TPR) repeat protein